MSRKYRHGGYQDEDRPSRSDPSGAKEPREDRFKPSRPRGRGLGAPTDEVFKCAACGATQTAPGSGSSDASCVSCDRHLHTCTNCVHFDSSARFQCRADIEQAISKKSTANDCPVYEPKVIMDFAKQRTRGPSDDGVAGGRGGGARSAFDDLFKDL